MNTNKSFSKILAWVLTFAMIFGTIPITVSAEGLPDGTIGEIIAFEPLEDDMSEQTVPFGTELAAINLPKTLMATVRVTSGAALGITEESEDLSEEESGEETDEESGKESESSEPEILEMELDVPVDWQAAPDYDGETSGEYVFTAAVSGFYVLTDLPQITVTVADKVELDNPDAITITAFDDLGDNAFIGFDLGDIHSVEELNLPDTLTGKDTEGAGIFVSGVEWACDSFDAEKSDAYEFTAVLPRGYALAEGVSAPVIMVFIRDGGFMAMSDTTVSNFDDLKAAITAFKSATEDTTITIYGEIDVTESLLISNATYTLTLTGGTLNNKVAGSYMLDLDIGAKLTLENITLDGKKDDTDYPSGTLSLIRVLYATLNMNAGAVLQNNKATSGGGVNVSSGTFMMNDGAVIQNNTAGNNGGGVYLSGDNAEFIMEGGTISGNTAQYGGGVYLYNASTGDVTFTMSDGTISDNAASENGGAVSIEVGTFEMGGGTISGNTAGNNGGGVDVSSNTFTMSGGTISDNTAGNNGGAVQVYSSGNFTMTGGLLFGRGTYSATALVSLATWMPDDSAESDGVAIHWSGADGTTYDANSTDDLNFLPNTAGVYWKTQGDESGIYYENGENEDFIPLDVTVSNAPVDGTVSSFAELKAAIEAFNTSGAKDTAIGVSKPIDIEEMLPIITNKNHTLTLTLAGDPIFTGSVSINFTIAKADQAALTVNEVTGKKVGDAAFALTVTGGSGNGAVTYAVASGNGTINGDMLTITGAGNIVVTATKAADDNYNEITSAQRTIVIGKAAQDTLTINSVVAQTYQEPNGTVPLSTSGGSGGGTVSYEVISGSGLISGSTLTITGAGNIVVRATKAADNDYEAATSADLTIMVNKAAQDTLTVNSVTGKVYGDAPFALSTTGGGGTGIVTYTLVSGPATLSGNTLTITGAGDIVITATKAADDNYHAATSAQQIITISKANQAALTVNAVTGKKVGDTPFTLATSGGSGMGAVTYTLVSGPATLSDNTVTITGAGDIIVTATKAADDNYNAATSVQRTITVSKADQAALTVNDPGAQTYTPGLTVTLGTTGGSGTGAISYTVVSGNATVTGNTLNITNAGNIVITATKAGDSDYEPITSAQRTIIVDKADQAAFAIDAVAAKTYGDAAFQLATTGGNGNGAVTYSLVSGTGTVTPGGSVTITGAGNIVVRATKAADDNYNAATSADLIITVNKANQTTPSISGGDINKVYGDAAFSLAATGGESTGAYSYSSSNTAVATVNGSGLVTLGTGASAIGSATITVKKLGDSNYNDSADSAGITLTVGRADQTAPTITYTKSGSIAGGVTITVTSPATGAQYSFDGTAGNEGSYGATATHTYGVGVTDGYVYVKLNATDTHNESAAASVHIDFNKQDQTAPGAFTMTCSYNKANNNFTVTIPANASVNAEYSFDGTNYGTTQTVTANPGDTVTGYIRMKETDDKNQSPATSSMLALPVPVTGITVTGAGDATTITANGGTLQMSADVLPTDATNANVTWSVTGAGATISESGLLTATSNGSVTVKATADDGYGKYGEATITVSGQITAVTSITDVPLTAKVGTPLTLTGTVNPSNATNKTIAWSVESAGTTGATINGSVLSTTATGIITVRATISNGIAAGDYTQDFTISVSVNAYTITFNANGGSVSPASAQTGADGKLTSLPTPARSSYRFDGWFTAASGGTQVTANTVFSVNTTIYAHWTYIDGGGDGGGGGGGSTTPTTPAAPETGDNKLTTPKGQDPIVDKDGNTTLPGGGTVETPGGGTIDTPAGTTIDKDGNITIPGDKAADMTLPGGQDVTLPGGSTIGNGGNITTGGNTQVNLPGDTTIDIPKGSTISNDGKLMVGEGGATINYGGITLHIEESTILILDDEIPLGYFAFAANPFSDVKESDWFYDYVIFAYTHGLFSGTSATTFSPNESMTRAMFATVLSRLDGAGLSGYTTSRFGDVEAGQWYSAPVEWAADMGIVNGTGNGNFDPNAPITREQMAVMLYNYMKYKGYTLSTGSVSPFNDEGSVSSWALEAVRVMQAAGIINGIPGNLYDPQGIAARAAVATIFTRFVESIAGVTPTGNNTAASSAANNNNFYAILPGKENEIAMLNENDRENEAQ